MLSLSLSMSRDPESAKMNSGEHLMTLGFKLGSIVALKLWLKVFTVTKGRNVNGKG